MTGQASQNKGRAPLPAAVALVMALAIGAGSGLVLTGCGSAPESAEPKPQHPEVLLDGRTTVGEDELDGVLGTYVYEGKEYTVTVREAIEESTSVDAMRTSDGSYELPSVDAVLAVARDRILAQDAEAHEISATDEDVVAYARDILGTEDLGVVAADYGMNVDQAREHLRRAATLRLLRDSVTTTKVPAQPGDLPPAPEKDKENEATEAYAAYVISLAGDEWDAGANTWAREDGEFREALRDYTIQNEGATYAACQVARDVALRRCAAAEQQLATEWTAYVNSILSHAAISLGSLVA